MITTFHQELVLELPEGTPIYLGAEYLSQHDTPPRIVMVPSTDRFARSQKPVGTRQSPERPLWSRTTRVSFYLWAASYDLIDSLLDEVSTAINNVAPAAEYVEGAYEEEGWVTNGCIYRFDVELESFITTTGTYTTIENIIGACIQETGV